MQKACSQRIIADATAIGDTHLLDRSLRPAEAATYLGLSPKTLANMRWRGDGPAYVKGPGRRGSVRYTQTEPIAWRNAHRRTSTSDMGGDRG